MIIYGVNTKELDSSMMTDGACPLCGTSLTVTISQRFAHIYFIPLFPLNKLAAGKCHRCRAEFEEKEFPAEVKEEVERIKKSTRTSPLLFSWVFIVGIIITVVQFKSFMGKHATSDYLEHPKVSDLYIVPMAKEEKGYPYVIMKLNEFVGDSVEVGIELHKYTDVDAADEAIDRGEIARSDEWVHGVIPRSGLAKFAEMAKEEGKEMRIRREEE